MKPIIFNTEMVQAIMDGRKTMTRRVIKPQPAIMANSKPLDGYSDSMIKAAGDFPTPKYKPGDVLWVRETWRSTDFEYHDGKWTASIQYKDLNKGPRVSWWDNTDVGEPDDCIYSKTGWRPSIHMPRSAARLFLKVTDVRVERVQDISTSDCEREGITSDIERFNGHMIPHHDWIVGEFSKLWDSINAKRGYGWDSNPWVWVYSFKRIGNPGVDA